MNIYNHEKGENSASVFFWLYMLEEIGILLIFILL